jgi:hypothetical protein
METTYPQAPVVLVRGRRHQHGGGDFAGDPRRLLGHRAAHCTLRQSHGESRGYALVEVAQETS